MKIMLCGRKGTGKNAAVDYLKATYGGEEFSFASPLYQIMYYCQAVIGVKQHKDRVFLQIVGEHVRETYGKTTWVDYLFSQVNKTPSGVNCYVADGRYTNELDAGKKNGFSIIQVVSDDNIRQTRRPNESIIDSHSSENGYPDDYPFDITIVNNGTLEEFHAELNKFVQPLLKE